MEDLSDITVTRGTAEALADAKFPQLSVYKWVQTLSRMQWYVRGGSESIPQAAWRIAAPTAEEVAGRLPDELKMPDGEPGFLTVTKINDFYYAMYRTPLDTNFYQVKSVHLAEALAFLWLRLREVE
jgi:hypothetical protein